MECTKWRLATQRERNQPAHKAPSDISDRETRGCSEGITVQIPQRSLKVLWQQSWKEGPCADVLAIVLKHGGPKFTEQYLHVCTEQG